MTVLKIQIFHWEECPRKIFHWEECPRKIFHWEECSRKIFHWEECPRKTGFVFPVKSVANMRRYLGREPFTDQFANYLKDS